MLALLLEFALQQVKINDIPPRHNSNTKIFTTRGNVWFMKTPDLDYFAPKQFSKMAEGSDDFACS